MLLRGFPHICSFDIETNTIFFIPAFFYKNRSRVADNFFELSVERLKIILILLEFLVDEIVPEITFAIISVRETHYHILEILLYDIYQDRNFRIF